jgi:hypothetical protein
MAHASSSSSSRCHDLHMIGRALTVLAVLVIAALAGCGSAGDDDTTTIRGGADPGTVQVIKGWADELRAGDVAAASKRFALPSVVQNGTPALRLTDRREVEAFNRSLPCGAKLTSAVAVDRFTIATFELTERPGAGECGNGVGETAKTAFVVREGLITQWRRVVDSGEGTSTTQGPVI